MKNKEFIVKVGIEVREIDSSWFQLEEYSGIIHNNYSEAKQELRKALNEDHVWHAWIIERR